MEARDRYGRHVPSTPIVVVRIEHEDVVVEGRQLRVRRGEDPYRAGLAAAAGRAEVYGRPVRVRLESRWGEWPLVVHPDGSVDDARGGTAEVALAGVGPGPRRRPVGVVVAALVAVAALLVGAVSTGVTRLSSATPAPPGSSTPADPTAEPADPPAAADPADPAQAPGASECRPVTLFALDGAPGGTVPAVADPLTERLADRLAVVRVPAPAEGTSYAARQQEALGSVSSTAAELATSCPDTRFVLLGHSDGAHVAGDLASRIGTGQEPRIAPERVLAVGLFGDPARSPFTRVVPDEAVGQGVLPARAAGFGVVEERVIEICAPGDPVCDSPSDAAFPSLEQALAAPQHASYPELPVAASLTSTQWAADSLGSLVASLPADGAADPPEQQPESGGQPEAGAPQAPGAAGTTTPQAPDAAGTTESQAPEYPEEPAAPEYPEEPAVPAPSGAPPATSAPPATTTAAPQSSGAQPAPQSSGAQTSAPRSSAPPSSGAPDDDGAAGSAPDAIFALAGVDGFDLGQGGNIEDGEVPQAVASPNVPGHEAVQLELPAGGKRSEVRPTDAAQDIREGERLFFGWSAFLPDGFPVDTDSFQVVWQLHDGETNTSPPVALEIQQGRLWLANVGELVQDLGPVEAGENVAVQMDIEFEVGGGTVSLWRDGRQVLDGFAPPRGTMIDSFDYLKSGLYRSQDGDPPATSLFLNDLKVGDSLASVSDLAGATGPAAVEVQALTDGLGLRWR